VAIDSAEKRKSVAGIGQWWFPSVFPNASLNQEWRQAVGHGYSGILAQGPAGDARNFVPVRDPQTITDEGLEVVETLIEDPINSTV
jgi:hypothetical protein